MPKITLIPSHTQTYMTLTKYKYKLSIIGVENHIFIYHISGREIGSRSMIIQLGRGKKKGREEGRKREGKKRGKEEGRKKLRKYKMKVHRTL